MRTWDPEPWDAGPETTGPGTPGYWNPRPGTCFWETCTFIKLQNKTLKINKSHTRKCDNSKYSFTYFSLIKIIVFFSQVKVFFLKFSEGFLIFVISQDEIFFHKIFWFSRSVTRKISRQILHEFFVQLAFHSTRNSLREVVGGTFSLTLSN